MNIRTISFRRIAARKILSLLLLLLLLPLLLSSCTYFSSYHRPINMRNNSKFSCLVQIIFQDAIFIVFVTQWNTTSIKLHLFSKISLIFDTLHFNKNISSMPYHHREWNELQEKGSCSDMNQHTMCHYVSSISSIFVYCKWQLFIIFLIPSSSFVLKNLLKSTWNIHQRVEGSSGV